MKFSKQITQKIMNWPGLPAGKNNIKGFIYYMYANYSAYMGGCGLVDKALGPGAEGPGFES